MVEAASTRTAMTSTRFPFDVYGRIVPISGPGFYAGVVVYRGQVIEAAPILRKRLLGKSLDEMLAIVKKRRWKLEVC
jgi:hypothetical protein